MKEKPSTKFIERKVISIDDIKPSEYNPRKISNEAKKGLAKSIEKFGIIQEIVVNKRNMKIIGGHQRVEVLREKGVKEIPVVFVDLNSIDEKTCNVTLNNQQIAGEFTTDIGAILEEIKIENLDLFKDLRLDDLKVELIDSKLLAGVEDKEGLTDPDAVPEVEAEPTCKRGEIYQLGKHRLMCGDSTDAGDVALLMDGKRADMVFTDPPYGLGFNYNLHDDSDNDANAKLVEKVFALHDCGKVWTCGVRNLARDITRFGKLKVAIWNKKFSLSGSGLGGASTWEPILILNPKIKKLKNDVIEIKTDREPDLNKKHPCPKPVALYCELLESFSEIKNLIFEPFLGSGTTLIACEKTGRTCYGMEIDPSYCDVIIKRYEDFTGDKAVLIKNT